MNEKSQKPKVHEIAVKNVILDPDLQPRSAMNVETVHEYSDAMVAGDVFPPIVLFFDGTNYWCPDGWSRTKATIKAGLPSIKAHVYQGDKEDALLYSFGANASHGQRRSNEDKRKAIIGMLSHPEWCKWADAEIARRCHVSRNMVSQYRERATELPGHGITLRVNKNGNLVDHSEPRAESRPQPSYKMPPVPLSKAELTETYVRRLVRAIKRGDVVVGEFIESPFGTCEILTESHAYFISNAQDRERLFAAIGKSIVVSRHFGVDVSPVIIGHFVASLRPLIDAACESGIPVYSPEELIREKEAKIA